LFFVRYAVILFLIPGPLSGQKIVKILDTNLFELETGKQIRLANVRTPSKTDTAFHNQNLINEILSFSKREMLDKKLQIRPVLHQDSTDGACGVHCNRKVGFQKIHVNREFLEKGFGSYFVDSDSVGVEDLINAESRARKHRQGIWAGPESNPLHNKKVMFFFGIMDNGLRNHYLSEGKNLYHETGISINPVRICNERGTALSIGRVFYNNRPDPEEIESQDHYSLDSPRGGHLVILINRYYNWEHFGFSIGGGILGRPWYSMPFILFPGMALRIGVLDKIYLSLDFAAQIAISPASAGLHAQWKSHSFHFNFTGFSGEEAYAISADWRVYRKIFLQSGFYWIPDYPSKGFRLGIGMVLD